MASKDGVIQMLRLDFGSVGIVMAFLVVSASKRGQVSVDMVFVKKGLSNKSEH